MTDHEHEWGEPGKNEAGDLHDYAVCQICRRVMYRTEVYAILNEHAELKRVRDAAEMLLKYGEVELEELLIVEAKNEALMKLAATYIKAYEEIAFADALIEDGG